MKLREVLITIALGAATPAAGQILPHIAIGGSYSTEFVVINSGSSSASVSVAFYDDTGKPMVVNFPDLKGTGNGFHSSSPLALGGSLVVVANDPTGPTRGGSAVITADAGISVQAIFRTRAADGKFYEASVPATGGSTRFVTPFDATTFTETGDPIYTGMAVTNLDNTRVAAVSCTAKDTAGATIANAVVVPTLAPLGHWADYNFSLLRGKRGLLDCTSNTNVAAIGLRFLGSNAFSSLTVVQSGAPGPVTSQQSQVVGQWGNDVSQTTFQGYYVPPREYAASINFRNDGSYSYSVRQTISPSWQMAVEGKYAVTAAPANTELAKFLVTLTPASISLTGLTSATQSSELSRLLYEGFPGNSSERFYATWDSQGVMHLKIADTSAHSCSLYPGR